MKTQKTATQETYTPTSKEPFFCTFFTIKGMQAAPAARMAGVLESSGQSWVRNLRTKPDFKFFMSKATTTVTRKPKLPSKKQFLIDYFDKYPEATAEDALQELSKTFREHEVKEAGVGERKCIPTLNKMTNQTDDWVKTYEASGMKYMHNCVFIDEAVVAGTSVFGATSARGVVNLEYRLPADARPSSTNETKKSHFLQFLTKTMDRMDKYLTMKGNYIIIDNSPVRDKKKTKELIESRGYKCVFLPPLSPEFNPIESFWAVLKSKVRKSQFKDMKARIFIAAFHEIHTGVFKQIVQNSVNKMKK